MKVLVVTDMQNDFIDGSLANKDAEGTVGKIANYIVSFKGLVIFTQDTHNANYLETKEGKHLPIVHTIVNSQGWKINDIIMKAAINNSNIAIEYIYKTTFAAGSRIAEYIKRNVQTVEQIEFCGTRTEICVISCALSTMEHFPETEIIVHKDLCSGTTKEAHEAALKVMQSCQIQVV